MMRATFALLAVLALNCAAFGTSVTIHSSGGSRNIPSVATSWSFTLANNVGAFNSMQGGTVTVTPVPEPASLVLMGTGLLFLSGSVRKILRKRKVSSTISS